MGNRIEPCRSRPSAYRSVQRRNLLCEIDDAEEPPFPFKGSTTDSRENKLRGRAKLSKTLRITGHLMSLGDAGREVWGKDAAWLLVVLGFAMIPSRIKPDRRGISRYLNEFGWSRPTNRQYHRMLNKGREWEQEKNKLCLVCNNWRLLSHLLV